MKRCLLIVKFLLICFCEISYSSSELLSVVQVFRHGERTPILFYPTDPYFDSKYWNGLGPGALTENGKKQLYNLGKYFRKTYDSFIGDEYNENQLKVKSSNAERNFQSAESFLNALFPNQKVPIEKADSPIISSIIICPKFDFEYLKLEGTNKQFIEVNENNKKLYNYIRQHSEFPIFGLASAMMIWDTLNIENKVNLSLPEWTKPVFSPQLVEISNNISKFICYNDVQQKLGVGPFLNELIEHFERIIEGVEEPKIFLYSGHDINLACFLNNFDYYKRNGSQHPPFASSLVFELRKNNKNEYFVKAYYKPKNKAIPINIKNCDLNCDFEQFKSIFENVRLTKEEWYKECFYLL